MNAAAPVSSRPAYRDRREDVPRRHGATAGFIEEHRTPRSVPCRGQTHRRRHLHDSPGSAFRLLGAMCIDLKHAPHRAGGCPTPGANVVVERSVTWWSAQRAQQDTHHELLDPGRLFTAFPGPRPGPLPEPVGQRATPCGSVSVARRSAGGTAFVEQGVFIGDTLREIGSAGPAPRPSPVSRARVTRRRSSRSTSSSSTATGCSPGTLTATGLAPKASTSRPESLPISSRTPT